MKRVLIAVDFDYDRDHDNDLLDVISVQQFDSELSHDESHEQTQFLLNDPEWFDAFAHAAVQALTGGATRFRSDEN